jgi:dihydrofolate reductase
MERRGKVRVFIACSLDGFIAGPSDELEWLFDHGDAEDTFGPFMAEVGALLMGRNTFDVVCAMDAPWAYGEVPVLVATSRPLPDDAPPTALAVGGGRVSTPGALLGRGAARCLS